MQPTLYLRADDAALSPGSNAAIEAATLTCPNIGLMAVGPALHDAAERFRSRSDLCLGLHFTLNSEWTSLRWGPLAPEERVPGLIQADGTFLPNPWRLPEGFAYDPLQVEAEMHTQLDKLRSLGLTIRYLDSHMACLRTRPELEDLARRFAEKEGLAYPDSMNKLKHGPCEGGLESALARWSALLDTLPGGPSIAIFHPAEADGVMETLAESPAQPGPLPVRQAERDLLSSPAFAALLQSKSITVQRFDRPATSY